MQTSPLNAADPERAATLEAYAGSRTRAQGGEAAVLDPAAWPPAQTLLYDASWRAAIQVEGPDARKWLNGMISANVRDLPVGRVLPAFQLDPKGHILATLEVASISSDGFLLLTTEDQRAELLERLRKFVFVSKLTLADLSEGWSPLVLRGPEWRRVWAAAGEAEIDAAAGACLSRTAAAGEELAVVSAPGGIPQLEFWAPPARLATLWSRLQPLATVAGSATAERDRILSRIPRYGVDVTAAELPQETGQSDRLDFTKGCYVGQEIVERIRARGGVHRRWVSLALEAAAAPGTALEVEGQPAGRLTSVAPRAGAWLGLGYLRQPHAVPGAVVTAGGIKARVEPERAEP